MKLNIAFDLDSCLVEIMDQMKYYLDLDGYEISDVCTYDVLPAVEPQITKEQLWQYFFKCYDNYDETPVIEGASELLEILHAKSQDPIHIITARPAWSASHTHALVQKFCKVPFTITFADDRFGKIAYLNGTDYFVEDRRETARELAARNKIVFMPDKTWNQMVTNDRIIRIAGVAELMNWTDKFIKQW